MFRTGGAGGVNPLLAPHFPPSINRPAHQHTIFSPSGGERHGNSRRTLKTAFTDYEPHVISSWERQFECIHVLEIESFLIELTSESSSKMWSPDDRLGTKVGGLRLANSLDDDLMEAKFCRLDLGRHNSRTLFEWRQRDVLPER